MKKDNRIPQSLFSDKKGGIVQMYSYKDILKNDNNPAWAREKMVNYALKHTQQKAAKKFKCHIETVQKWYRRRHLPEEIRYQNQSRRPKTSPNKISDEIETQIIKCRKEMGMGANNLKYQYDIPASSSTIYAVLKRREHDLGKDKVKPLRKKRETKKDLREVKAKYKAFECLQIDGKVLYDIPEFYLQYKLYDIPRVQWTIRCQKTGATFISYSKGETMIAGLTFVTYFFEHLKRHVGAKAFKKMNIRLNTDWGSYAIGTKHSYKKSEFTQFLKEYYGVKHKLIKHKNSNSEVERFHGLVEDYFYKRVNLNSRDDLFSKASEHIIWFNYIRKNLYRGKKTPLEFLNECSKESKRNIDPQVLALPAIDLDKHQDIYFYKKDPNHKPLAKEDLFQDSLTMLESLGYRDESSEKNFLHTPEKGRGHVSDLDGSASFFFATFLSY